MVNICPADPMLPAVHLMPKRMSGYDPDVMSVLSDFDEPFFAFTSMGTRLDRVLTKKSSSSVEFSRL